MNSRRIVVTGLGMISPLGNTVEDSWQSLVAGKSGIGKIESFDSEAFATQISGQVKNFDVTQYDLTTKDARKIDVFIQYALAASYQAMKDAKLDTNKESKAIDPARIGVAVGSGIGGISTIEQTCLDIDKKGPRRVSPFFIPATVVNMAAGNIAIKYGLQGPNFAIATACTNGTHNIGYGARTIAYGDADIMIVVAYGLLLPLAVLEAPKMGCLNVHASILPRWRGAAPIQRAIQAGDTETGITIMQMDVGLDTGDMLSKTLLDIHADETGGSLHDRLLEKGPTALLQTLTLLQAGEAIAEKQDDSLANYAHKLTKEEALIDWCLPAKDIELSVRAFNPFPCAFTLLGDQRIKVWQAITLDEATNLLPGTIARVSNEGVDVATGAGMIRLLNIQLIGKKAMTVRDFINGQPNLFQPQHMFASQA